MRGLRLAYHVWGDRRAPPIVLVHGFMDQGLSWSPVAELLASRFFLIAPDLRGHGYSDWVGNGCDYCFYDYFSDLQRLVDHLGIETFGLVGHSMGGAASIGLSALTRERVRSLVLLEGMGPPAHDLSDTVGRLQRWYGALQRSDVDRDVEGRRRSRHPMASVEGAAVRMRRTNARLTEARALAFATTLTELADTDHGFGVVWRCDPLHRVPSAKPYVLDEAFAMWRALGMPVLSLFGAETPFIPEDLSLRHRSIPSLRVGTVDEAGHNLHHDQPDVIAAAIEGFIDDPGTPLPAGIRETPP